MANLYCPVCGKFENDGREFSKYHIEFIKHLRAELGLSLADAKMLADKTRDAVDSRSFVAPAFSRVLWGVLHGYLVQNRARWSSSDLARITDAIGDAVSKFDK